MENQNNTAPKSDIEVNYKRRDRKRYNTAKYPIRQPIFIVWLIWVLCKFALIGKKHKVEKVNMKGLKPPYIMLSNHMYFIDFELAALGTFPHRVNNVVSIDGYLHRAWLMELIGCICTRKFVNDLHLVKSIKRVIEKGDILSLYPEARYSPIGTTAYLPESLGKMVKLAKAPLVIVTHHGNHLHTPFWDYKRSRKVPLHTVMKQVLTAEQVVEMSADEINAVIKEAMTYDEYRYQKENGILITEPFRAEGLHKVLYQCPHCMTESKMASEGAEIFCTECGKRWTLLETGELQANDGETEFSHIPDWFEWERAQVRGQIERGEYSYCDTVDVYSMPNTKGFVHLGEAKLTHDLENGFVLEGFYNKNEYRMQRLPGSLNSLHVEYDYSRLKPFDCIDISTNNDSFYCYPSQQNIVTKLSFATEEMYRIKSEDRKNKRR